MERIICTTIYDEILHRIETITKSELDSNPQTLNAGILKAKIELQDSKGGKLIVTILNSTSLREELGKLGRQLRPEEQIPFLRYVFSKHLLFAAQDVILFRILCSHYINNQNNGVVTLKLDTIHKLYRKKAFKYDKDNDKYDEETLKAYYNSIIKLSNITIIIDFTKSCFQIANTYKQKEIPTINSKLLTVTTAVAADSISKIEFNYTIGKLGEYIINNKQFGQFLPAEIYSLRFNQIDTFNMAVYIARMIIMNKRKSKSVNVYVSTMLSKIMKYDKSGQNRMVTYMDYLILIDSVKRGKLIKNVKSQVESILDLLKSKECIFDYEFIGKWQFKYIRDGELYIAIIVKGKKSKGN